MIIPVILAGGSGTRLWPLSRQLYPKQLMNLVNDNTMLQNTILRTSRFPEICAPIIICNENHRFMIAEQLRRLNIQPAAIILEPVGRNTAPALAVAALQAKQAESDPLLLVLPADHHMEDITAFHSALSSGVHFAEKKYLITFGIVPNAPETGYGYIRKGGPLQGAGTGFQAMILDEFVEKPDRKTAEGYLASGDYLWNSGIFLFKTSRVLEELKTHAPDILNACEQSFSKGKKDLDFFRLDPDSFAACPSDSIDYAVMEHTEKGAVVPLDAGWNDLGSWEALWQVGAKDDHQNVIQGDVLVEDVKNSYLRAASRLIAAVGLDDHIVVETADAVVISPRKRVQDVKRLVDRLKRHNRREALNHLKEYRPWGASEDIDRSERFQVKRLTVKPGAKMSLQKHYNRAEHWIIVKGTARVTRGEEQFILKEDQSTYIPIGVPHRLENPGKVALELIEVQTGSFLGEDDIERLEDIYGR